MTTHLCPPIVAKVAVAVPSGVVVEATPCNASLVLLLLLLINSRRGRFLFSIMVNICKNKNIPLSSHKKLMY